MLKSQSMNDFLDALAAKTATPGGGSVAALNGAMGASLVSMVCRLTIGKKKYADVESEMRDILRQSESLSADLAAMVAKDSEAFNAVMAAYRLPKETNSQQQARTIAIEAALKKATLVPLETARACAHVIDLCKPLARKANVNALSDVGSGAMAAYAGLKSAALNVYINLSSIQDPAFVAAKKSELDNILTNRQQQTEEIYQLIETSL